MFGIRNATMSLLGWFKWFHLCQAPNSARIPIHVTCEAIGNGRTKSDEVGLECDVSLSLSLSSHTP